MRTPPMIVCPYCGPENIMYAGKVLSIVCRMCRDAIAKGPVCGSQVIGAREEKQHV